MIKIIQGSYYQNIDIFLHEKVLFCIIIELYHHFLIKLIYLYYE